MPFAGDFCGFNGQYSKIGYLDDVRLYPTNEHPTVWDAPTGFYFTAAADTPTIAGIPEGLTGRSYILKSKNSNENFCWLLSPFTNKSYLGYQYGTRYAWQQIATHSDMDSLKFIKTFDFGAFDYKTETIDTVMKYIFSTMMPLYFLMREAISYFTGKVAVF